MNVAIINAQHAITLPETVRSRMRLYPGRQVEIIDHGDRLELIPMPMANDLIGVLSNARNIPFERDKTDRVP